MEWCGEKYENVFKLDKFYTVFENFIKREPYSKCIFVLFIIQKLTVFMTYKFNISIKITKKNLPCSFLRI